MKSFFVFNDGYILIKKNNKSIGYEIYNCNKKLTDKGNENILKYLNLTEDEIATQILIFHGFDPSDLHISKKFI